MQDFFAAVLVKVLLDPKVQQQVKNLLSELITEKIAPLVPLAAASAARAVTALLPNAVHDVEDVVTIANRVRDDLNKVIPNIPVLDIVGDLLSVWKF